MPAYRIIVFLTRARRKPHLVGGTLQTNIHYIYTYMLGMQTKVYMCPFHPSAPDLPFFPNLAGLFPITKPPCYYTIDTRYTPGS